MLHTYVAHVTIIVNARHRIPGARTLWTAMRQRTHNCYVLQRCSSNSQPWFNLPHLSTEDQLIATCAGQPISIGLRNTVTSQGHARLGPGKLQSSDGQFCFSSTLETCTLEPYAARMPLARGELIDSCCCWSSRTTGCPRVGTLLWNLGNDTPVAVGQLLLRS